ncbi:MAG: hypothetical protein AB1711_06545 [Thermodesulfobacteriota bacterium]
MEPSIDNQLNQLFESRYHGAANISGIKYQLTYAVYRTFDLFKPDAPDSIQLEGIEDVDLKGHKHIEFTGFNVSNEYVQVKTSKKAWDWSRFARSGIIQNFLPVLSADQTATLLVVTNFGYTGALDEFVKFCKGDRNILSNKMNRNLHDLCRRAGYQGIDLKELIRHISFVRIIDEELMKKVTDAIITAFDLTTCNADLYFGVLMSNFIELASQRKEVRRVDLESIRLFVQEQINLGSKNPATQNGWIERLKFEKEEHPEDYYEGKNARLGHILADLDVRRHDWEIRIHEALQRSHVCIVRASSGQGKSTLLYRYAFEHYHPETALVIKQLSDESMVSPIKQAVVARQRLGLPILIFIDNVSEGLQFWHKLAAEFAGQEVYFLITIREEDWFRYSGNASGFVWEIVTPTLSLQEAQNIFSQFQSKGKIASGVPSAEWAYEQVADRQLLIEYTYLVTHGQMLADRLKDQVKQLQRLGEDQAKLQILRLVSVAQAYGAKVAIKSILQHIPFEQDPDSTLRSLEREYLLFTDGVCEGLHFVRSQHLIPLLHGVIPVENTMIESVQILDADNLEPFISSTFADSGLDHACLLDALVSKCQQEPLSIINKIAKALFRASEVTYYRLHQGLFDTAFDQIGSPGIFILCSGTLPFQTINLLENLKGVFGVDHPNYTLLSDLAKQFTPRQWDERYEVKFLQMAIDNVTADRLITDFSEIGALLGWCQLPGISPYRIVQTLSERDWQDQIYKADLLSAANFLIVLHDHARENYDHILATEKDSLMSFFKLSSDTLLINERNGDIYIEFIVDEQKGNMRPSDQAVERLRNLRKFFPDYQHYCSQGLYVSLLGLQPPVDDTKKAISNDTLRLEIDAEKNAIYMKAIKAYYTSQSVYEWQKQWFILRTELLDFVSKCTEFYKWLFNGRQPKVDALNDSLRKSLQQAQRLKDLPVKLAERFNEEQKLIGGWETSMRNFVMQFAEHDLNDDAQKSSRLMRYNLKDAVTQIPGAHRAFHSIVTETQSYFDMSDLDEQESASYSYLADILDFWFERPSGKVHNLRSAIDARRHNQRKQFTDALCATLIPLTEQGFSFVYPTAPFLEHPLIGLVLGFDVVNFEHVFLEIALILEQLASFPHQCHFVYLVPLLKGSRYSSHVWRIAFDKIKEIIEGKAESKEWALLPLEPPATLFKVLPPLEQISLDEAYLENEFYRLYGSLNIIRNTVHFVRNRIDENQPFEIQLAEKLLGRFDSEIEQISAGVSNLFEQMLQFANGNSAASEWLDFAQACLKKIGNINDIKTSDTSTFGPTNISQEMELQSLLGRYRNAKYLRTTQQGKD